MKNLFCSLAVAIPLCMTAQVTIGTSAVSSPSVSLEFGSANKGMVLPWVVSTAAVSNVANGTMVYSLEDHKMWVKYNSAWKDLSINAAGTTVNPLSGTDAAAIQNSIAENTDAKVTIGADSSVSGILVLGDQNKAMVLPKVSNPHLNIINPAPGMMVFDSAKKLFAVFNGSVWSFWKP